MTLTVGSLCSGGGGIDYGLEKAGMTIRWQSEIDPYACRVLAHHWPDTPNHGDLRKLTGEELEPVDLVAAGFPCQPVSNAGFKRGHDDARWLWPDIARLLGVVRPRFVLLENVPGLLARGMGTVLGDLAALGFDAEWSVVSACSLGAPHTRERLFIVAHAHGQFRQAWLGRDEAGQEPLSTGRDRPGVVGWMEPFAGVRGVVDGTPKRVDRLRLVGNGVAVPVIEQIGRWIVEAAS